MLHVCVENTHKNTRRLTPTRIYTNREREREREGERERERDGIFTE